MDERRKAHRWHPHQDTVSTVMYAGKKEEVSITDISMHGMKIMYSHPVETGEDLFGRILILPEVDPFFVRGKVVRVERNGEGWKVSISFDKVRTYDFSEPKLHVI